MKLRSLIFWPHLIAGVIAGVVILIMSLTGVLLMYERQLIAWADRHDVAAPSPAAERLSVEQLLTRVHEAQPDAPVTAVTLRAGARETALVSLGQRNVQVNPYTGELLPEAGSGMRSFMSSLRSWHRWLAMSNENRPIAKFITGWSNFIFAFIVLSGIYLWLPRMWTWVSVHAVLFFRGGLRAKARDFNWHNVIGIWSCVPLFFVVITAFPISFPWAGNLLYRLVGEEPPAPAAPPGGAGGAGRAGQAGEAGRAGRGGEHREQVPFERLIAGLDPVFTRAAQQVEGWRSINLRVPQTPDAPLAFTIDQGDGGQPQLRSTLTLSRVGDVVRWEPFESQSLGRRLRSWSRFTHTGEAFGLVGQTIAGLVSGGACVLVYTGLALSLRRFLAWRRRLAAQRAAARVDSFEGAMS